MQLPLSATNNIPVFVKLIKAIYGLKQAGKLWNDLITTALIDFGFIQSKADACVFTKRSEDEETNIVLHVDDLLVTTNNSIYAKQLHQHLSDKFGTVNDVTESQTHLGILIDKLSDGCLKLSQPGYIDHICDILDIEFNLESNIFTPLPISIDLNPISPPISITEYRKILGLLNHIAIHTRPDILYGVSFLATYTAKPTEYHLQIAHRIIKYLINTKTLGLTFSPDGPIQLFSYVDASYNSHSDAKSHSGFTFSIGNNTAAFHSKSSKQKLVTRSSTESEFFALDSAVTDIQWFRHLLNEFGYTQNKPTTIFEDNQSTILLTKQDVNF
jgi:hypothetical protein